MKAAIPFLILLGFAWHATHAQVEEKERSWNGDAVSLSLSDVAPGEAVVEIVRNEGFAVVAQKGLDLKSPVTVQLQKVPWDQALDAVARVNEIEARIVGNIVLLSDTSVPDGLSVWAPTNESTWSGVSEDPRR